MTVRDGVISDGILSLWSKVVKRSLSVPHFESGIRMSRKRNAGLRFIERASEFAASGHPESLVFPAIQAQTIPNFTLAQALNRAEEENCIVGCVKFVS